MDKAGEAVVREYVKAWPDDYATLGRLRAEDFVEEWPQSGELIRGHDNNRAIHERYPGGLPRPSIDRLSGTPDTWAISPSFTLVHITGSGSSFTVEGGLRYPDGSAYKMVAILELADDKVIRQRTYFAPHLPAPDWRAPWVERSTED